MKTRILCKTSVAVMMITTTLACASVFAQVQGRYANVYNRSQVGAFVTRLEQSSNIFRRDFDRYMDRSNLNGTSTEDRYNAMVSDFESSLNRLRSQFDRSNAWWDNRNYVRDMIERAQPVNTMMLDLPFGRNLETQWRNMRDDINKVADTFDLPGLNGGGWNGGNNPGGWNGGNSGGGWSAAGQISPPSWAVGTFYGRDTAGRRITVNIATNGSVSADADGTPFYGSFTRGNYLSFADGTSRVTREGDGFWTTRTSNGERTFFSRNGYGSGGGGGNIDGYGDRINPPDWAVGTFYGTDQAGRRITITIARNGSVNADANGTAFFGAFTRGNTLSFADGTSRVTREGNGFWTTRNSNGERTFFSRSGYGSGGGVGGGGGVGIEGNRINPPSWAVGTFYGTDPSGARVVLTISSNGAVAATANGGAPFYGSFIRGNYLRMDDGESRVTREGNGFWTTHTGNGKRIFYSR